MPTIRSLSAPVSILTLLLLVVLTLSLSIRGGTDPDVDATQAEVAALRLELEAMTEREAIFRERIILLEGSMEQIEGTVGKLDRRDDPLELIATTDAELARLADALTALETDLTAITEAEERDSEAAATANAEIRAEIAAARDAVAEVRTEVGSAQSRIGTLGAEVEELRTLTTTLRDRLDRLQRGG